MHKLNFFPFDKIALWFFYVLASGRMLIFQEFRRGIEICDAWLVQVIWGLFILNCKNKLILQRKSCWGKKENNKKKIELEIASSTTRLFKLMLIVL